MGFVHFILGLAACSSATGPLPPVGQIKIKKSAYRCLRIGTSQYHVTYQMQIFIACIWPVLRISSEAMRDVLLRNPTTVLLWSVHSGAERMTLERSTHLVDPRYKRRGQHIYLLKKLFAVGRRTGPMRLFLEFP